MARKALIAALTLSIVTTGGAKADYLTITMTNAQVTSVQDGGGAGKIAPTGGLSRNR